MAASPELRPSHVTDDAAPCHLQQPNNAPNEQENHASWMKPGPWAGGRGQSVAGLNGGYK